jgi:hypothetical protein
MIFYNYHKGICDDIDRIIEELNLLALKGESELKSIKNGWLKPVQQLAHLNSRSKINCLPKIRAREKKQIFLKTA